MKLKMTAIGHTQEQPEQQMALISTGPDASTFFARDITLHRNVGWKHTAGVLSIVRPVGLAAGERFLGDSGMFAHTISADSVEQRNAIGRRGCCRWAVAPDLAPPPILSSRVDFDGRPVTAWARPLGGQLATASVAWSADLSRSPSLAGQLVYFAVRVELQADTAATVGLSIDPGSGQWESSCAVPPAQAFKHVSPGCIRPAPPSSASTTYQTIVSFATELQLSGVARFAIEIQEHAAPAANASDILVLISAGDMSDTAPPYAGIDAAVVVAPVGAAWNDVQ